MILAIPPLVAEPIFNIGAFPVTNSYINSILVVLVVVTLGYLLRKGTAEIPRGLQNAAEAVLEVLLGYMDGVTHDRKQSLRFLPIVGALFFFILLSNWMGLLPGVGSIGRWLVMHGHVEFVPVFRAATADLNTTLAIAVFAVFSSHVIGVASIGFFKYANKFIKLGDLYHGIRRGGSHALVAFVEFGVGLIEIFSEIAKMVSLSLRLFGNVFAGEVLLTVMAGLVAYFVPLPFMLLEILVGLIQAVVFSMLTLVYLTLASLPPHGEAHAEHKAAPAH
jgi:F-type H+-transporting ATPase subunit a